MKLKALNKMTESFSNTDKMPVLFLGHGSPMNAIEENEFVTGFRNVGKQIPRPNAILCISAHWETKGTFITAMERPATIHDYKGFPETLAEVKYPAPGSPQLAREAKDMIKKTEIVLDDQRGFDHGAWSVIKHLYPDADVPVIEISLDCTQGARHHYELAKELAPLRDKGVLIMGSGNIVHNVELLVWERLNAEEYGLDWALESKKKVNNLILNDDYQPLIDYTSQGRLFDLAIPTAEHYLPLLYALALKEDNEKVSLFNDKIVAGTLSMTSLKIEK